MIAKKKLGPKGSGASVGAKVRLTPQPYDDISLLSPRSRAIWLRRGIDYRTQPTDAEIRLESRRQKALLLVLARRIRQGRPISDLPMLTQQIAAARLIAATRELPDLPRRRGQKPKLSPLAVAIDFAFMIRRDGETVTNAHDKLAELYNVSVTAIKKCLKKNSALASLLLETMHNKTITKK